MVVARPDRTGSCSDLSNHFSRTLRSLQLDRLRGWTGWLLVASALLMLWGGWFFFSRVTILAVSDRARLETDREVHPVEAPVAGRITEVRAGLEEEVEAGRVLFVLQADEQKLELEEERTHLQSLSDQLAVLVQELSGSREGLEDWRRAAGTELEVSRARLEESEGAARIAAEEEGRLQVLHEQGLASEMDLVRARSVTQQRRSGAEALRLSVSRLELEQRSQERQRQAAIDNLERERALLEGDISTAEATIARLEEQVERRAIRAPISGRLGEVALVQPGSFVNEGDRLATIVPSGELAAVADFEPSEALGRIRPGQRAHLRLTGFPSTQFGTLPAEVERVASEAREGRIRVELALAASPAGGIPLEHGLPGTVEIEVERLSPAALVLRILGKVVDRPVKRAGLE
jgi:membrane fusion protein (multidrug efflux system)